MTKHRIEFIPEAVKDYRNLDGSVRKKADKKLSELEESPYAGAPLGNRYGINLTGFYKIYFNNRRHRIVYRLLGGQVEIVEIWGIGKREKEEIYKLVGKRLKKI